MINELNRNAEPTYSSRDAYDMRQAIASQGMTAGPALAQHATSQDSLFTEVNDMIRQTTLTSVNSRDFAKQLVILIQMRTYNTALEQVHISSM